MSTRCCTFSSSAWRFEFELLHYPLFEIYGYENNLTSNIDLLEMLVEDYKDAILYLCRLLYLANRIADFVKTLSSGLMVRDDKSFVKFIECRFTDVSDSISSLASGRCSS